MPESDEQQDKSHAFFLYMCASLDLGTWRAGKSVMKNRFLDWLNNYDLQKTCKWYFKWNALMLTLLIVSMFFVERMIDYWGLDEEEGFDVVELFMGLFSLVNLFTTYILDYVIADRVLQVREKRPILLYLLNATYIASLLLSIIVDENISHYIKVLSTILYFIFYALILRYGYTVYRSAIWLMIYAVVLHESGLGVIILILYIASYVKLYLTAKEFDM